MVATVDPIGVRKAAVLLMCLPRPAAAKLLARLPPHQIEAVGLQIAQSDLISGDEQSAVIDEFLQSKASALNTTGGGFDAARELITVAMGSEAHELLGNLQQTIEALPFGFLKNVDPENLLAFIADEHPQTIARVLSYLHPTYAAQVLAGLNPDKQLAVIQRIATMGNANPEAVTELEKGLESRLSNLLTRSQKNVGGIGAVAEMLNVSERSVERHLMDQLAKENPELMDEIRRLMFVFEDIVKLADREVQTLLKNVETNQWAMALKGSSQQLQEKVMRNMSSRAADNLREEIEFLGAVRVSEVEAVQQRIVDVIRHLEDTGQLSRPSGDARDDFIS
jgi:flagellar motor switch protein FliG